MAAGKFSELRLLSLYVVRSLERLIRCISHTVQSNSRHTLIFPSVGETEIMLAGRENLHDNGSAASKYKQRKVQRSGFELNLTLNLYKSRFVEIILHAAVSCHRIDNIAI